MSKTAENIQRPVEGDPIARGMKALIEEFGGAAVLKAMAELSRRTKVPGHTVAVLKCA
jgi:hypothetical protein